MTQNAPLAALLALFALPWSLVRDGSAAPCRKGRIPEGWDFGSMPMDQRDADWS